MHGTGWGGGGNSFNLGSWHKTQPDIERTHHVKAQNFRKLERISGLLF
jgi:hypothetical protein